MSEWIEMLLVDPLPRLLSTGDDALTFFVQRDLLEGTTKPVEGLWQLREVERLLKKQSEDGAWRYPGGGKAHLRPTEDYDQLETYRVMGQLVEKYGLNKGHPAIGRAAEYLFAKQTGEGDFRGIYGNQYTPNYSAAIMEHLIKAGYGADPRIERGFQWLLSIRQQDGGWAIPLRSAGRKFDQTTLAAEPVPPDTSRPSSHLVTGIVLRAFAAHPDHRRSEEARIAGEQLKTRFFKPDRYVDRKAPAYWTKFQYPFRWTDILTALDSLSLLGFPREDADVQEALGWFVSNQEEDGLWPISYGKGKKAETARLWVGLAACRVFRRLHGESRPDA